MTALEEEQKVHIERLSRTVRRLEEDEKHSNEVVKVQAETIGLLIKGGSDKKLMRCMNWLDQNTSSKEEKEDARHLPTVKEFAGFASRRRAP